MPLFQPAAPLFDPRMALYDAYNPRYDYQQDYFEQKMENGSYNSMQPPRVAGYGVRRSMNIVAILTALFAPFALFMVSFYAMSFELYYQHPNCAVGVVFFAFFVTLVIGAFWTQALRMEMAGGPSTWHHFIFATGLVAVFLGSLLGNLNFQWNTKSYYDYISLRKVVDVQPGVWVGQQVLDAGTIDFKTGNHIDILLGSAWHKSKSYCAAPIVPWNQNYSAPFNQNFSKPLASYDFWAVGMDCCSQKFGDFTCGNVGPGFQAHPSGLRVIDADEIQGYQLAAKQALAAHSISADRMIFLYPMVQPYLKIKEYWNEAMTILGVSAACHLIMQSVLVYMFALGSGGGEPSGYLLDAKPFN
jgi:hypothetical protein